MNLKSSLTFDNKISLVKKNQSVNDIIIEILSAHEDFSRQYDQICRYFWKGSVKGTADFIFDFLKKNIKYKIEPEERQSVQSPAAILNNAEGDCKHYASFAAGILDALRRTGKKIDWRYCFASYSLIDRDPEHIFVKVKGAGRDIWIDPTPGSEDVKPFWIIEKKKFVEYKNKKMPLYRISGNTNAAYILDDYKSSEDYQSSPDYYNAIELLINYGVIKLNGDIDSSRLVELGKILNTSEHRKIVDAMKIVNSAGKISGLFNTIWRGVKKVSLAVPRMAYLSLVFLNVRGWATKLHRAIYNEDGTYTKYKESIKKLWQDRLGGDWTKLENTINKGWQKKAVLKGIGAAPAVPAWLVTASAIIAAITPLLESILKALNKNQPIETETGEYLPETLPEQATNKNNLMPLLLIGGGVAAIYFLNKKKK